MAVKAIRITDPYVISLVEMERLSSGVKTATKMAGQLIIERVAMNNAERANQTPEPKKDVDNG